MNEAQVALRSSAGRKTRGAGIGLTQTDQKLGREAIHQSESSASVMKRASDE
ncbi:hypothetical protein LG3211_0769 [Lysobacter gummosus]|nr:hypothetical protein LG3211_0769 [Lysobacter gummosus]